jgi:tRNA 2-thiouridine synthesizing protein A
MHSGRLFFDSNCTDRSSDRFAKPAAVAEPLLSVFSPGNFFAVFLDRTVIYYQGGITMNTNATQSLDTRGMNCPLPILRTKKALSALSAGETLAVTATDPGSLKDMQAFCKQTGHELVSSSTNQGEFEFLIRKA